MSQAASQMDRGYDQTLSDLSSIVTGDASTEYIEAWARVRFGDQLYEAASAIKKRGFYGNRRCCRLYGPGGHIWWKLEKSA